PRDDAGEHPRAEAANDRNIDAPPREVSTKRLQGGRYDDGKRGAEHHLHSYGLWDIKQRKYFVEDRNEDAATADAEQAREKACDEATRDQHESEQHEFTAGQPELHDACRSYSAARAAGARPSASAMASIST